MDSILATIGAAVTVGSALGALIASFFAYKQKTLVTLLRESNIDYQARVRQLEDDREERIKENNELTEQVKTLENEKRLPLDRLTKLVEEQNKQIMRLLKGIIKALPPKIAKEMEDER